MKKLRLIAPFFILALLTGCADLGPIDVTPITTYTLNTSPTNISSVKLSTSIAILPIYAAHGFDSNAMMYQKEPYVLTAFANNAWIAPPASMITMLLAQTLQQSQAFKIVLTAPTLSSAHYSISALLLYLYQDFTVSPSQITVGIDVNLINNHNNKTLSEKVFTTRIKTNADTPYGGVIAANQAVSTLLGQISQYVINTIATAQQAAS